MLAGNFFEIGLISSGNGRVEANLEINATHPIFEGHFPGQPVVPGVCMMQMVKEVLEAEIGSRTRLAHADHLKFLTVLNPVENNIVRIEINYKAAENDKIDVAAIILNGPVIYFKMRGGFVKEKLPEASD